MKRERRLEGLSLKVSPLGENDRLLTVLSEEEGLTRLAVPGARKPRSSLAAAIPLTFLNLQIAGSKGLSRVRQLKVMRSYNNLGQTLETLSAAQALSELSLMLVTVNSPVPGLLKTLIMHLERLDEQEKSNKKFPETTLAICLQACVHLLALGGYGIPIQKCCFRDVPLDPPLGNWDWRCSLIPEEGFAVGSVNDAAIELNPSELALLQRLIKPNLPIGSNGELMGPREVWLRLLVVIDCWITTHLVHKIRSLSILREALI